MDMNPLWTAGSPPALQPGEAVGQDRSPAIDVGDPIVELERV